MALQNAVPGAALTDVGGGETWRRIPVSRGDVLLGDRIYGTPTGVAHVLRGHADVIARVNHNALPLYEPDGDAFQVFRHFRSLRVGKPQAWKTYVVHEGRLLHGRLIAVKRSAEATRRAQKRVARKASRKQTKISKHCWKMTQYFSVWTSLPTGTSRTRCLRRIGSVGKLNWRSKG